MDRTWLDRMAAMVEGWDSGAGTGHSVECIPNDNLVLVSQFGAVLNVIYSKSINYALMQHDVAS